MFDRVDHDGSDAGTSVRPRLRSWAPEPPPGAYAIVPAWTSGAAWFDALMDALATPEGEEIRRRVKVSPGTLLRVARRDWQSADVATGRGVTTAHATVAAELGMSKKTVQRAREIIQELGYAVTILEGSYLTNEERRAAREHHRGSQIRVASTRALTVPKPAIDPHSVENVHLPRRANALKESSFNEYSPTRASALERTAAQSKAAINQRRAAARAGNVERPRPIDVQRFIGTLAQRMPWLARGRHIGQLAGVLERSGVDVGRWTVNDLLAAIERFSHEAGVKVTAPGDQRNPLAYFGWLLRNSVDPDGSTPTERREAERAQKLARQRRAREEAERERARIAEIDPAEVDAIIAQMKADIAAAAARRRATNRGPASDDETRIVWRS